MVSTMDLKIKYSYILNTGRTINYEIVLDSITQQIHHKSKDSYPFWCKLDYMQCAHCPFSMSEHKYCPITINLVDVVDLFKNVLSYDRAEIIVETNQRTYSKKEVPIQSGLSSMIGIIMVTSGCIDLDKLRPMVRYHLPFASIEETVYRATSMYMLAQYMRVKNNNEPNISMDELVDIYKKINDINLAFSKRLRGLLEADSNLKAIALLDTLSQSVPMKIEETLDDLINLFESYYS